MKKTALILICLYAGLSAQVQFKRTSLLPSGLYTGLAGRVICYDTDHNGLKELIFSTGTIYPSDPLRWEVWEYRPLNHFELVYADTGYYPPHPGIMDGCFRPWDVGDIDRDGLVDLAGHNEDWTQGTDSMYNLLVTYECPSDTSFPESLTWSFRWGVNETHSSPVYLRNDLDGDSYREFVNATGNPQIGWGVWENVGNNQNELVWHSLTPDGWALAFGDFDQDGRQEFATAALGGGPVSVLKCTGDDQYELVYQDTTHLPNGSDVFSGDVNGDARPEFFVGFYEYPSSTFRLYMWRATGINTYQRVFVDRNVNMTTVSPERSSKCGDVDGDGVDEIAWATPENLFLYKETGPDQFHQVWQWRQDQGIGEGIIVNIADVNNDGYNEIIVGGGGRDSRISVFEVEAVRVLVPNGGEIFVPGHAMVRWQAFAPPRCDSFSVWFTPDNGRTFEPLGHGIPPTDSSVGWTVPEINSDSCKVRVVAYGPGTQFDESDSYFSIVTASKAEAGLPIIRETRLLSISPNPIRDQAVVRFQLAEPGRVTLRISDVTGRSVETLVDDVLKPGAYVSSWHAQGVASGIYFLSFAASEVRTTSKLILSR